MYLVGPFGPHYLWYDVCYVHSSSIKETNKITQSQCMGFIYSCATSHVFYFLSITCNGVYSHCATFCMVFILHCAHKCMVFIHTVPQVSWKFILPVPQGAWCFTLVPQGMEFISHLPQLHGCYILHCCHKWHGVIPIPVATSAWCLVTLFQVHVFNFTLDRCHGVYIHTVHK